MRTPNIDNIARRGMTFTNFYANCTVCSPSRASLLSGKYPNFVGVPGVIRQNPENSWGYLDPDSKLIPQVLNPVYHSGIVGKWHLGYVYPNHPVDRGFNYFKGFLGDMMDDYWTHLRDDKNWMRFNKEIIDPEGHATDLFTKWAIEYIDSVENTGQPYFLYLAYNAPHFPIQPPENYLKKVIDREPDISLTRAKNVAFIEHLDDNIGRLMDFLSLDRRLEKTLVVFVSDNGGFLPIEQSNGLLNGGKGDHLEGGIKVPAFMMWENVIEPASHTDVLAMHMDLFATFCDISESDINQEIQGISLTDVLKGNASRIPDRTLFWVRRDGGSVAGKAYYAVRKGNFKMLQNNPDEAMQLFNLEEDPYEVNPIDLDGDIVSSQLKMELQRFIQSSGSIPWQKRKEFSD